MKRAIFAPFNVPLERRLQTAAVFYYIFIFLILPLPSLILPVYVFLYTPIWWLSLLYLSWMYWDRSAATRGGRPAEWFRNQSVWRYFVRYFPIKLIKTTELPPDRNYIFGAHPHGVMSLANFASFCTNATGFDQLFDGLKCSPVTLQSMFYFPLRRELVIASGAISSDRASIDYVLNGDDGRGTVGRVVCIALGGAEEALDSHPDNYDLTLSTRRGFIKVALQHGASLVPVYHFGETSAFYQLPNKRGSRLRHYQTIFKNRFGFSPPLFFGRGIFNYAFGLLPYRTPINSVVGAPIAVERCEAPTSEQISELHAKYCAALNELFDSHKTKYGIDKATGLNIR